MNIDSVLKKEGIRVIGQLNNVEMNKIASNISSKIANAFSEHNISQRDLYDEISRLNMFIAEMPEDTAVAKYFYKNNSIYFSSTMDLSNLNDLAVHECLHYMQELKNKNGKLLRLGLYNLDGVVRHGMALNEAAVQHMASVATGSKIDTVKYYNMTLNTESPDFYPILTALLNEMTYFTGTYPLYHSTLFSNDVFKNTFIAKSNAKAYSKIETNFDLILTYENSLAKEINKLQACSEDVNNINKVKRINSRIVDYKQIILDKTIETQNMIITNCFETGYSMIKSLEDISNFELSLQTFRSVLITTKDYSFYDKFCSDMTEKLDEKREFILKYGNILTLESITKELTRVEEHTYGWAFFKKLFSKIKLLVEDALREKEL